MRWSFIVVLICISLISSKVEHYFLCWPSVCLLWRKSIFKSSAHSLIGLFVLLLSCMSCSYILEIKPLSVASFAHIFSQSLGYLLLMVFFAMQKLISLIRSHLFLLSFLLPWETELRKPFYDLCQRIFCLCFPLGVLWYHILYLSLQAILNLFLCMVWGSVLTSLWQAAISYFISHQLSTGLNNSLSCAARTEKRWERGRGKKDRLTKYEIKKEGDKKGR